MTSPPPPPDPFNYEAPEYLNPKFASSPIEIEGGPSAEYQQANAAWGAQMDDMYDRGLAEYFWGQGDRDAVQAILARNPNVGIQYNRVGFGLPSVSGSVFGMEAAKVLNALGTLLDEGIFVQVGGPGFSRSQAFAHAPQDPLPQAKPSPHPTPVPLSKSDQENQEAWERCVKIAIGDQLGIKELLVGAGLIPVPKRQVGLKVTAGASESTNVTSYVGHKLFRGANLPFKVFGTDRIFGIAGRASPWVAAAMAGYDIYRIAKKVSWCNSSYNVHQAMQFVHP